MTIASQPKRVPVAESLAANPDAGVVNAAALVAQLRELSAQLEALDFNPNQSRDADGKFGEGGGGGDKTAEMTPVGGGHGGGGSGQGGGGSHHDPNATQPSIKVGDHHGDAPTHGKGAEHAKPTSGVRTAPGKHFDDGEDHKHIANDESRRASDRADRMSKAADAKPSAAAHDKAATANRIASTMHKTAAQLIPERAEHHEAAARAHARAAEHHEAEMHKHEPHAANATLKLSVDVVCLGALTDDAGKAKTEFRIFRSGSNPSTKGNFEFSSAAAKAVMARFAEMGRRVSIDYNHASLNPNPTNPAEAAKSAGSFIPEVRDGELWATDVQWTDAAKRGVEAKEWLYYSPAFAKTAKNVPTWLISVGLTNDPSLWNLDDMAVAASALYPEATKAVLAAEPAMLLPVPTVQQPISDATNAAAAEQTRREFAMRAAISWCVQNPATKRPNPEAPQHPAAIAPLTGVYADPEANGGFLGWSEPAGALQTPGRIAVGNPALETTPAPGNSGRNWIAFQHRDGSCYLWTDRNEDGSVRGEPIVWQRDMTTLAALGGLPAAGLPEVVMKPSGKGQGTMTPAVSAAAPSVPAGTPVAQQRIKGGKFTFGKAIKPGMGGESGDVLRAGISRRADIASARAHEGGTSALHRAAANINRAVAGEHTDAAEDHRKLAEKYPQHSATHTSEVSKHETAAKRHIARADRHDATADDIDDLHRGPAMFALSALVPNAATTAMLGMGNCQVVDADDYDWRRANALATAEAALADPEVKAGPAPDHAAATAPLTGRFVDPMSQGSARWLGWIEPANKSWICFVALDGRAVLYTKRSAGGANEAMRDGAGIGTPVVFTRTIETLSVAAGAPVVDVNMAADITSLSAVPYKAWPVADGDDWDAAAAEKRLREWASSDGSGDPAKMDWQKYAAGFAYVAEPEGGAEHTFGDFLLPHHDVKDGALVTVRKGVIAAAQRLDQTSIPADDKAAVRDHLQRHYHQWGATAPWEQTNQGKAPTMHAKLSDYMKANGFDKDAMKSRLKLAAPGHLHATAMDALGDDAAKHDDSAIAKIMKALDAFDKMSDAAPDSSKRGAKLAAQLAALNAKVPSVVALGAALGLPAGAPEADVINSVAQTLDGFRQLSAITGESSMTGSLATVKSWRTSAEEGKTAMARLNAIEVESKQREAIASLDKAVADKGLTPAQRTEALGIFHADGVVGLNAYLKGAVGNPALAHGNGAPPPPPANFTPATPQQVAALNAAGALPGAPAPGARPASEQPAGGATPPAVRPTLSKRQQRWVKDAGITDEMLNAMSVDEVTALTALDLDD